MYDMDYDLVAEVALSNGSSFINDVYVTKDYAYFTDTNQPQFYAVRLGLWIRHSQEMKFLPLQNPPFFNLRNPSR